MPSVFAFNLQFFYLCALISFFQPFEKLAKSDGHCHDFIDKVNINAYNEIIAMLSEQKTKQFNTYYQNESKY